PGRGTTTLPRHAGSAARHAACSARHAGVVVRARGAPGAPRVVGVKNLTRDEAAERARTLHVESYDVHLDLTREDGFDSTTTIRFRATPGTTTFLELDGELVEARGVATGEQQGNRIPLLDLAADNELTVRGRCVYSRTGEGLHRFTDPADGLVYLWAMSFLDDAQRMFACFDQPDLKASIRLTVDAPAEWTVIGNERGTRTGDRWEFAPTQRMSTYGFTVAAGPWHSTTGRHDGIDLGLHCRQSLAPHLDADAAELFEITAQCFDLQQELFGRRYPFGDTYDQLFVPEFNHGAMENPGAVTFMEDFVFRSRVTDDQRRMRAMVVAHEMAHMWFGNLVTMRWWDDLWLNESFAELMGFLTTDRATRFERTWEDFSARRKAWGYRADQLPSTHPVQGDVPDSRSALLNFDGISYSKGASVLRQLMATVGEDAFFTAVRAYFALHAFGNTTFADLLAELETASGRDLQEWSRAWLQTSGLSTLRSTGTAVQQESDVLRPHRIGVGLYDRTEQGLVLRQRLDVTVDGASADLGIDEADRPDLLLLNDGDLSFAKVRFDDRSLATVLTDLRLLSDPLARALCWSALWDACRDAELPAADFVQAVLAGVDGESDPSVTETLLSQARTAALLYTADGSALVDALAQASLAAAFAAPEGSDLQLARTRAYARVTRDPAPLQGLLDGSAVPQGLAVDTDLRWTVVKALAALGQLDEAAVDAELAGDNTAAGVRSALTARASLPDAEVKERAWVQAVSAEGMSNHEVHALAEGFWQPGQDALLQPYVARFVDELPGMWQRLSPEMVGRLTALLFPSTLVTQKVLDATQVLLDEQHPAGMRRYVAEARDDLARALRARAVR
ncbi:MAG: aminopeptidase, partial [Frankiales bacterium]|nr:aminopeptidase [Frankiales bacterium]